MRHDAPWQGWAVAQTGTPAVRRDRQVDLAPNVGLAPNVDLVPNVQLAPNVELVPNVELAPNVGLAPIVDLARAPNDDIEEAPRHNQSTGPRMHTHPLRNTDQHVCLGVAGRVVWERVGAEMVRMEREVWRIDR